MDALLGTWNICKCTGTSWSHQLIGLSHSRAPYSGDEWPLFEHHIEHRGFVLNSHLLWDACAIQVTNSLFLHYHIHIIIASWLDIPLAFSVLFATSCVHIYQLKYRHRSCWVLGTVDRYVCGKNNQITCKLFWSRGSTHLHYISGVWVVFIHAYFPINYPIAVCLFHMQ